MSLAFFPKRHAPAPHLSLMFYISYSTPSFYVSKALVVLVSRGVSTHLCLGLRCVEVSLDPNLPLLDLHIFLQSKSL